MSLLGGVVEWCCMEGGHPISQATIFYPHVFCEDQKLVKKGGHWAPADTGANPA